MKRLASRIPPRALVVVLLCGYAGSLLTALYAPMPWLRQYIAFMAVTIVAAILVLLSCLEQGESQKER